MQLGAKMNPNDIEEGDDVYFGCEVDANPPAYKVVWEHNVSQHLSVVLFCRAILCALRGKCREWLLERADKKVAAVYLRLRFPIDCSLY